MEKLTATGRPFGEGKIDSPKGAGDHIWEQMKKEMIKDGTIQKMRNTLSGFSKEAIKYAFRKFVEENLPDTNSEDCIRYADELATLVRP